MSKRLITVILMIGLFLLAGCGGGNKASEEFHPYQKMTQLEDMSQTPDPNWTEQIKSQLTDTYGVSETTSERLIKESKFEWYQLEYGATQEYENQQYPYCFKANMIIWKSESFYAICDISDKTIVSPDDNIKLTAEGPEQPWTVKITLLKVLPVNQSEELTMGSRVSFSKDGKEKIGPFTIAQTVYISFPTY